MYTVAGHIFLFYNVKKSGGCHTLTLADPLQRPVNFPVTFPPPQILPNQHHHQRLTDGVVEADRKPLVPGVAPLTLLDAAGRGAENTAPGGSIRNAHEAQAVAALVAALLRAGGRGRGVDGNGGTAGRKGREDGCPVSAASIGVICLCESRKE